jgi:dCTP diphosphatase
MKKTLPIEELLEIIKKFVSDRDWEQFHSVKNLTMALSVESSELLEIFQWVSEEESNLTSNSDRLSKTKDEIADIFVYLVRIADRLNIDIEEAVRHKMDKNMVKYPIEKSKGNSKKYTEF